MLEQIKSKLNNTEDIIVRSFELHGQAAFLIYLETLCDRSKLEISVFKQWFQVNSDNESNVNIDMMVTAAAIETCRSIEDAVKALLQGNGLIGIVATNKYYSFNAEQSNTRSINEPDNERSIIGERVGFVEQLVVNLNLLRTRTAAASFKVRYFNIGKQSNHKVAVVWIEGLADGPIVDETIRRISGIKSQVEVHPGKLQHALTESKRSIFPQVYGTERIDMASGLLLQGRIAVLCEQSSTCLIVPASFYTFYRTVDSLLSSRATAITLYTLRSIGTFLSLYVCSIYIAIVMFHHEVLPSKMSVNIKSSLENVPYPPNIEAIIMIVIFQLIAEATIRLPSQLAQMVGVAGGLIISEALVKIGFVSNVYIVIVALSMIGSFSIPTFQMRIFSLILQVVLLVGATILGFYGIVFITAALLIHFFSLEPFGIPYCMPIRSRSK